MGGVPTMITDAVVTTVAVWTTGHLMVITDKEVAIRLVRLCAVEIISLVIAF